MPDPSVSVFPAEAGSGRTPTAHRVSHRSRYADGRCSHQRLVCAPSSFAHFAEVMYTGFLALKDDYQRDRYGRRVSTSGPSALQPAGLSAWASVAKCSHTSSYTVASTASGAGTASWSPSRIAGQLRLRLLGRDRHDIPRQPHACQAQDQPAGGVELVPAQAVER